MEKDTPSRIPYSLEELNRRRASEFTTKHETTRKIRLKEKKKENPSRIKYTQKGMWKKKWRNNRKRRTQIKATNIIHNSCNIQRWKRLPNPSFSGSISFSCNLKTIRARNSWTSVTNFLLDIQMPRIFGVCLRRWNESENFHYEWNGVGSFREFGEVLTNEREKKRQTPTSNTREM